MILRQDSVPTRDTTTLSVIEVSDNALSIPIDGDGNIVEMKQKHPDDILHSAKEFDCGIGRFDHRPESEARHLACVHADCDTDSSEVV
jgi:hypothetical protein